MKVQPKNFKGIEYVQVNQLPKDQYEKIQQTISKSLYIKILIDGKVVSGCMQYKDYALWFDNIFSKARSEGAAAISKTVANMKA